MVAKDLTLHSPFRVEECRERLVSSLREDSQSIKGMIQENRFWYRERRIFPVSGSSFYPRICGVLMPDAVGTAIQARFENDRTLYIFVGAISAVFVLVGMCTAVGDLFGTSTLFRDNIEYVPKFVAIWSAGILGSLLFARAVIEESKKILLAHLREVLLVVD